MRDKKKPQCIVTERINSILEKSGLRSNRAFATKAGINEVTFGDTLRGAEPKFTTLEAILKAFPKLSAEWLMRGEGGMYRDGAPTQVAVVSENRTGNGDIVSHTTAIKSDNDGALVELLRAQLAQKDEQIRQKDEQLRQVLNLLNK